MRTIELIKSANKNLWRNKLRTFLTVSAIFIGAFTLTITNGLGDGMRAYIESDVKNTESKNVLFISPKPVGMNAADYPFQYKGTDENDGVKVLRDNFKLVTLDKIKSLAAETPEVKGFSPTLGLQGEYLEFPGGRKYVVMLSTATSGVTYKLQSGNPVANDGEIILSYPLARSINENFNGIVGQEIKLAYKTSSGELKTIQLKVVGIATKGLVTSYFSYVNQQTAQAIYDDQNRQENNYNLFSRFSFELNTEDETKIKEIKNVLSEKGFDAMTLADQSKRSYDSIEVARWSLNLFAFIALLAASFGIINTLVIAVMERTKEIGLHKALGMSRGKVFLAFTIESILIGFWGAISGIITAVAVGTIVSRYFVRDYMKSFAEYDLLNFTPTSILFVALLICVIAFLAGVLPAWRASRLNPIVALRYE